jgi:hypothetical protein
MELDYMAQLEIRLDAQDMKIKALENALTQLPFVNMQVDPSRPSGVVVEPAALNGL